MTLKKTADDAHNHMNSDQSQIDEFFMKKALQLARKAELKGEVPVGALIVDHKKKIISIATNMRETDKSALGHAELVAIHRACKKLNTWRLLDCTLYVTLEPCFMCAGALVQSRISRVVYGSHDPKGGALESLAQLASHPKLNHKFEVKSGILADESSKLLKNFFRKKRQKRA